MAYFTKSAWECPHHRMIFTGARVNRDGLKIWRFECANKHVYGYPCVRQARVIANMWAPELLGKPAPTRNTDGSLNYSAVTMSA